MLMFNDMLLLVTSANEPKLHEQNQGVSLHRISSLQHLGNESQLTSSPNYHSVVVTMP
jgi:hypothetical protein